MLALGEHLARAGRLSDAADAYRRLIGREPLHEEAYRRLMMSLAQLGRRSEAIRYYERLVALLRTELEAEPEGETISLAERIRSGERA
jgi:DNA-binding SARP family transcriptional activator